MKARVVQGGIGSYEVQTKSCWLCPWATVYVGILPWRGSKRQAFELANRLRNRY